MIEWDTARVAAAAGAELQGGHAEHGPRRTGIDSRAVAAGELFVGLPGTRVDGGAYAAQALRDGAWGVLVAPVHAAQALAVLHEAAAGVRASAAGGEGSAAGVVLVHPDPLAGLQALARAWRRELGARVVAVTGSTGKTSTKDILAALLRQQLRTVASPANLNTEIGLPLAVLGAPLGTEALVLELAMRGPGQIAELTAIAEPEVGVIVNIGPVHLELLGSLQAIAAAKAELIAGLPAGASVAIPAAEPLLAPHLREEVHTITFGPGGDVELAAAHPDGEVTIRARGGPRDDDELIRLRPSFAQSHNLRNLLAAVAAARALGVTPAGRLEVTFSALRGERVALAREIVLINDCYNANPMSMRAALEDLAASASARRVAVLGDMLELGPEEERLHRELAAQAAASGVELLVAVGPLARTTAEAFGGEAHHVSDAAAAAALLPGLLRPRDTVLVKGSRGVGLEVVGQRLAEAPGAAEPAVDGRSVR